MGAAAKQKERIASIRTPRYRGDDAQLRASVGSTNGTSFRAVRQRVTHSWLQCRRILTRSVTEVPGLLASLTLRVCVDFEGY